VREPLVALAADEIAAAVLRDDASGLEAPLGVSCEGRLELVGPAEVGQGSIGQRKTPSLGLRVGLTAARRPPRGKSVLAGGGVEPEGDAELDFHERDLLSLDDRASVRAEADPVNRLRERSISRLISSGLDHAGLRGE
jgi:hypothetical protein